MTQRPNVSIAASNVSEVGIHLLWHSNHAERNCLGKSADLDRSLTTKRAARGGCPRRGRQRHTERAFQNTWPARRRVRRASSLLALRLDRLRLPRLLGILPESHRVKISLSAWPPRYRISLNGSAFEQSYTAEVGHRAIEMATLEGLVSALVPQARLNPALKNELKSHATDILNRYIWLNLPISPGLTAW